MKAETQEKKKVATSKKATNSETATKAEKKVTPLQNGATAKNAIQKIESILTPNGKSIVKRLQHAQILANKFEKMSERYDDLTHFIAGKDTENSSMKFASEGGYTFTLHNPAVITKVLEVIEIEFSKYLEEAEQELLNFQIQ